jgi:hypothetical protein
VQFDKGDSIFLLNKCHTTATGTKRHIVASGVVSGVVGDMFHGVVIEDEVYKVEVHGVMLPKTTLIFHMKDDPPQLLLKDVKSQFTFWEGANLRKIS